MAQILQSLSYKACFIILPKFNSFGLFILILGTSAIMDQTACCYNMTTSEIGLLSVPGKKLDSQPSSIFKLISFKYPHLFAKGLTSREIRAFNNVIYSANIKTDENGGKSFQYTVVHK